ncbi:hypothetical protein F4604DRAFT_1761294 [Suillus subluteus]|nr:hypothetical protein F4604DRAFT_1761294 [Suillus subluteus]
MDIGTALMPSEHLLLQAVRETTREICRVAMKMWASGLIVGVDPFYPPGQCPQADRIHTLMGEWKEDVTLLISWLDWRVWVKCQPACGIGRIGNVLLAYLARGVFPGSQRCGRCSAILGQCFLMARPKQRGMEETTTQVHQTAGAIWFLGYNIHS